MAYITLKNNTEKEIKILYEEDKSKPDSNFATLISKTLKVWVDGNVVGEHDNMKQDLESYQSKITLTLNPPKR